MAQHREQQAVQQVLMHWLQMRRVLDQQQELPVQPIQALVILPLVQKVQPGRHRQPQELSALQTKQHLTVVRRPNVVVGFLIHVEEQQLLVQLLQIFCRTIEQRILVSFLAVRLVLVLELVLVLCYLMAAYYSSLFHYKHYRITGVVSIGAFYTYIYSLRYGGCILYSNSARIPCHPACHPLEQQELVVLECRRRVRP